jgi:hypothetical protein
MANHQQSVSLIDTQFPVIEKPATYAFNEEAGISDVKLNTGYKFILREDTGAVISCMTDEYKLVTNEEVVTQITPVMDANNAVFKEAHIFGEGARASWTWYFPQIKVKVGENDILNPEITVKNSYDGSLELSFTAGAYRLICANGMIIGTIIDMKKNRHSIYNTNLYKISEAITDTVNKCQEVFVEDFQTLIDTKVTKRHIADVIKTLPQQAVNPFVMYIGRNSMENYWDLLNAFTWVTTHALNRTHESTHKLENRVYPLIRKMAQA